jgi:rhamnosyltransferase
MQGRKIKATIFIPTYNGEQYIGEIIEAIYGQKTDYNYEVLIIDSGSTDATLEIIKSYVQRFKTIRLHEIPNSEFGHGKTRNLAAKLAHGEYIVYLTHDATPATETWLYEMLKPFEISSDIVAVMGRQIPRGHCIPMLKYEIVDTFSGLGPEFSTVLYYKDSFIDSRSVFDAVRFYSDVNSATKVDFVLNEIPYRDVDYAEDQLFGEDLLEAGFTKAYAPRGAVLHSNDVAFKEYRHRIFDETLALRRSGAIIQPLSRLAVAKIAIKCIVRNTIRITRDSGYSKKRKGYWILVNPLFQVEKWRGYWVALTVSLDDEKAISGHSLEAKKKSNP